MRLAGTGCSLVDFLYANVDFSGAGFERYRSRNPGDGGLEPGCLVFTEHLEAFAGKPLAEIMREIVGDDVDQADAVDADHELQDEVGQP